MTFREAFHLLYPIAPKWSDIGLSLGLAHSTLVHIKIDYLISAEYLRQMLNVWFSRKPQQVQTILSNAVRPIDSTIADKILQKINVKLQVVYKIHVIWYNL